MIAHHILHANHPIMLDPVPPLKVLRPRCVHVLHLSFNQPAGTKLWSLITSFIQVIQILLDPLPALNVLRSQCGHVLDSLFWFYHPSYFTSLVSIRNMPMALFLGNRLPSIADQFASDYNSLLSSQVPPCSEQHYGHPWHQTPLSSYSTTTPNDFIL